jgi:hypothetical protein
MDAIGFPPGESLDPFYHPEGNSVGARRGSELAMRARTAARMWQTEVQSIRVGSSCAHADNETKTKTVATKISGVGAGAGVGGGGIGERGESGTQPQAGLAVFGSGFAV